MIRTQPLGCALPRQLMLQTAAAAESRAPARTPMVIVAPTQCACARRVSHAKPGERRGGSHLDPQLEPQLFLRRWPPFVTLSGWCHCTSAGYELCGDDPTNLLCVDKQTDPTHCGECFNVCPDGQTCQGGTCGCPPGAYWPNQRRSVHRQCPTSAWAANMRANRARQMLLQARPIAETAFA